MSDTPETDSLARGNHVVPTSWAEQLERERDEANKQALYYKTRYELLKDSINVFAKDDGICLDCGGPLQAVRPGKHQCNNCDNLRHTETMLEETAKLAATLKRERDEARDLAVRFRSMYYTQLGINWSASWFPWESRQQLATQADSTPQDNPTRHDGRVEKTEQDLQP